MAGESRLVQSVIAVVLKGSWNSLFNPKLGSLRLVSSTTVAQVLLQLSLRGHGVWASWAFFRWLESFPGSNYAHSLQSTWTMIHVLAKHRHYRAAQELLDKISHRDFLSSPPVLSALVATHDDSDTNSHVLSWLVIIYAKSRMTQDALQVFDQMRLRGLRPHLHACTAVLNGLVRDRMSDVVWKVFKKMTRLGVAPNVHVYNVLIHACCVSGDVDRAEGLVSEMDLENVRPDIVTYNTLISLYCKRSLHYEALSVQHRMEKAGLRPDIVTYNSLLYSFCREGRMREAVRLFREIVDHVVPNHVTYTTLIDGYCRSSDLDESLRLLEVMRSRGLYPGVVAYNSILRSLCREGRLREGNKLLLEMSERKINPDNVTCNTLINAYCKIGDMRSATRVRDKMVEAGLKLDAFTYKALVHGFCRARDMDSAREVLFAMLDSRFSPNYCTYSWVVDGYCDVGKEDAVVRLPDEFAERGLCVDASLCRSLIRRLCKRERVDSAEKIFNFMRWKNWPGDCVIYASLAYANMKAGKSDVSAAILNEMQSKRLLITRKIYRSFNDSRGRNDDCDLLAKFWDQLADRGIMSKKTS